jgi:hypothetical protein
MLLLLRLRFIHVCAYAQHLRLAASGIALEVRPDRAALLAPTGKLLL